MLNFMLLLAFVSPSHGAAFGTAMLSITYMSQPACDRHPDHALPVIVTVKASHIKRSTPLPLSDLFEKVQSSAG